MSCHWPPCMFAVGVRSDIFTCTHLVVLRKSTWMAHQVSWKIQTVQDIRSLAVILRMMYSMDARKWPLGASFCIRFIAWYFETFSTQLLVSLVIILVPTQRQWSLREPCSVRTHAFSRYALTKEMWGYVRAEDPPPSHFDTFLLEYKVSQRRR